jgi:hypothetical protein
MAVTEGAASRTAEHGTEDGQHKLEAEADRLLGLGPRGCGGDEYPFYPEQRLDERIREGRNALLAPELRVQEVSSGAELLDDLIRACKLTEGERRVISLRRAGRTSCEIARALRTKAPRVSRLEQRAVNKLAMAAQRRRPTVRLTPRQAILSAHAEETNRPVYSRPHCCPEGRERCRGTDLCDQRWYLFVDRIPDHRTH